jgi:nucleoside-diphosphate-sugar epimerase
MSHSEKRVFLTGANGFVASHILADLIEVRNPLKLANIMIHCLTISVQLRYQITASVRSESKAQEILHLHPQWKGKVTFVFVKDIASPSAFRNVFMQEKIGFDYIIHTASPVNFSATDLQKDLIDPAIQGYVSKLQFSAHAGDLTHEKEQQDF